MTPGRTSAGGGHAITSPPAARTGETEFMSATILLVEDNADNQEIYRIILAHHGYHVLQAFDGGHGVELARAHGPDLILMDLTMPVIDGLEATRMLKADPATAAIPIVALTAHTAGEDRAAAAEAGCEAFLSKPVEPQRVAAEVQRILANGGAADEASGPDASARPARPAATDGAGG